MKINICTECGGRMQVVQVWNEDGYIRRRRRCLKCGSYSYTVEKVLYTKPPKGKNNGNMDNECRNL